MRFGKLPDNIMSRQDLSSTAKVVYVALAMYRNGRTLQCNPSQAEVAKAIGMSIYRVRDALKELLSTKTIERCYIEGRQTTYSLPDFDRENDPATLSESTQGTLSESTQGTLSESTQGTLSESTQGEWADSPRESGQIHLESLIKVSEQTIEQTIEQTQNNGQHPRKKSADVLPLLRAKLEASPHWPFITHLSEWFYAQPHTDRPTESALLHAQEAVEKILRLDMEDQQGCEQRLGKIVRFAIEDEGDEKWAGWKPNFLSLATLANRRHKSDPPKWRKIEASLQQATRRAPPIDPGLDRLNKELAAARRLRTGEPQ